MIGASFSMASMQATFPASETCQARPLLPTRSRDSGQHHGVKTCTAQHGARQGCRHSLSKV